MPRIAVVIPTYNRVLELKRALQSVARQTFKDFEIVVVNDGGMPPDDTVSDLLPSNAVRFLNRSNGGPGAARNTGLLASDSEYIAYLDDDDEWEPDHLDTHVSMLETSDLVGITYGIADVVNQGVHHRYWGDCRFNKFILDGFHTIFPMSACVHRRTLLDTAGRFDENPLLIGPEDCEFAIRVSDLVSPVPSRHCTVTMHRDCSMTREPREEWVDVLEYVIKKLGYGATRTNWLMFYRAYVAALNENHVDLATQWANELDRQLPLNYRRVNASIEGARHIEPDGIKTFCRTELKD
jgi:glycosyltransferase involved in cell wall biosynthesis